MNCDQVFQYLTSTRPHDWNGDLSRHVAGCESCRAMAELFRPALVLFGDDASEQSASDAPRPWQDIWDAVSVAERAAAQLHDRTITTSRLRPRRAGPLLRAAALLVAGVVVGGLLGRVGAFGSQPSLASPTAGSADMEFSQGVAAGRCENLVAYLRDAFATESCPTCERPVTNARRPALALCVVCHRDAPASQIQSEPSWQSLLPSGFDDERTN
jgi:hypothetical protein